MPLLPNATATRYRPSPQVLGTDRRPVPPTYATAQVRVHVEPASPDDRQSLPEGVRTGRTNVVFAPMGWLSLPNLNTRTEADRLTFVMDRGTEPGVFVVMKIEAYMGLVPHDRALVVEVQEIEPAPGTPWPEEGP